VERHIRAGRRLDASALQRTIVKIFAERDALSNRMIEDISRHMSSAPPTMRASNQIKYDSNSIAKLARAARVLFSAAHN
jgi:hypothetical protein